jgi:hypothetical protein
LLSEFEEEEIKKEASRNGPDIPRTRFLDVLPAPITPVHLIKAEGRQGHDEELPRSDMVKLFGTGEWFGTLPLFVDQFV